MFIMFGLKLGWGKLEVRNSISYVGGKSLITKPPLLFSRSALARLLESGGGDRN